MRYLLLLLFATSAWGADNTITIDQIGSNNSYTVSQDGVGHSASVTTGRVSDVDYLTLSITQGGTGAKTATVEVKSGINNGITISQDGAGNHTASIQNLAGNANNITISQSGAGSHEFNVINTAGSTNSNNTITGTEWWCGCRQVVQCMAQWSQRSHCECYPNFKHSQSSQYEYQLRCRYLRNLELHTTIITKGEAYELVQTHTP